MPRMILVFTILFFSFTVYAGEETLSGDSTIFGRLKETHTAIFDGDRGVTIIEDKIFLYNKNDSINRVEVLEVPTLKSLWSLSGSYYFIQTCEGKKSYAILHSGDWEVPTIDVYQLTGRRKATFSNHEAGGIEASPNGESFYPSDGMGADFVARFLNDSVVVWAYYNQARITAITNERSFDSIPYPNEFGGGYAARSKFGGQVLLNWHGVSYYIDSTMRFQKIEDSLFYANIVRISQDGKFGFLFVSKREKSLVAYRLSDLQRIWIETFIFEEDHYIRDIEIIPVDKFLCISFTEVKGYQEQQVIGRQSLILQLDPITGQQIERVVVDKRVRIGNREKEIFSVTSEIADNKTKLTLKLWE